MKQEMNHFKGKEKKKNRYRSEIHSLSMDLSPLSLAYQLTEKVSRIGFDWPTIEGVLEKLEEEMNEFKQALRIQNRKKMVEEMGDLLFVLVNIARVVRIDPEQALRKTIKKSKQVDIEIDEKKKELSK